MHARPKVLIVGNYCLDGLESMERYAQLLVRIYGLNSSVKLLRPKPLFASSNSLPKALRKYLAYIDKLLLFPIYLLSCASAFDRIHIADHGNAFYTLFLRSRKSIVTCHDLLAVRAAFGDTSTACKPSPIGIWLQRLILAGLRRAGTVVFVSKASLLDYQRLIGNPLGQRQIVIPNPLNAPFCPDAFAFILSPAEDSLVPRVPYLLMVGSSLPRKNRGLALQVLEKLGSSSKYYLVFAGDPLTQAEKVFLNQHPLGDRLISIERPSHALLNRLYCQAHALIFPSFSEGFGWPLLEAQSCGCPVIASCTTSIPEVAGSGALYADPSNVEAFLAHVYALEQPSERLRLISLGFENIGRFSLSTISEVYRTEALQL